MIKRFLFITLLGILFVGCSTEKNNLKNRTYHKMTAWYNILFNGQVAMDEELNGLKDSYQDDYSEILRVDPLPKFESRDFEEIEEDAFIAGAQRQANNGGLFNRVASGNLLDNSQSSKTGLAKTEEKAIKAIQKHSMEIRGIEYNKMVAKAYLMLGQSRFYQGKTFPALEALNYAKDQLPATKYSNEIDLFLGLTHLQAGNKDAGEQLLSELYYDEDDKLKKEMKAKAAKYTAQYLIDQGNLVGALEALEKTEDLTKNRKQRARYNYIMGQVLSREGKLEEAAERFTKAYDLKPGFDFEVKSQVAIAENFDPKKHDYNAFINHFKSVAKKGNYVSRRNELDYALGLIALRKGNLEEAEKYLDASLSSENITDQYVRSKAYLAYADLSFANRNYVHTSAYYDSAYNVMPYEKQKEILQEKNQKLKEIIEQYYLVQKNDSILQLAYLPKKDQESYFKKYIDKLKEEDVKKQEEQEEQLYEFQTESKISGFTQTFSDDSEKGKFYFYNTNAKNFGKSEFQRIWGNIRLADNWRNSARPATADEREAELLGQDEEGNPRRYDVAFYLEQIPTEKNELNNLKVERDTTELKLGINYYEVLEDADLAIETLEHLIQTPPKEDETKLVAYYNLYKIADGTGLSNKETYKNNVLNNYPNSVYANYILNPNGGLDDSSSEEAIAFYEATYDLFKEEEFDKVLNQVKSAKQQFKSDPLIPKFELLNAVAEGKINGKLNFEKSLKSLTLSYPGTLEATKANEFLAKLSNVDLQNKGKSKDQIKANEQKELDDIYKGLNEEEIELIKKAQAEGRPIDRLFDKKKN